MAEAFVITRSEVDSIIVPATGRFALVMDGQTIELGKTGRRDVSGLLDPAKIQGIVAGQLLVARSQSTVTINGSVTFAADAEGNVQFTKTGLGAGFAPPRNMFQKLAEGPTFGITTAGNLYMNPIAKNSALFVRFEVTYIVDGSWPSTLPGVELGQPIVI